MERNISESLLIIFTKNPEIGKVKTRLAVTTGNETALNIYKFLLQHTLSVTSNLNTDKWIYYSEEIPEKDIWPSEIFSKKLQQGEDLGEKMENAFREAFKHNYEKVIIIGSDLYDIVQNDLENAFLELEKNDFVIGPAKDGGYYLLGMKSLIPELFKNKKWSSSSVLSDTLKDLKNKKIKLLETRNDIDEFHDIKNEPAFSKFLN
ncbi:TIGR04282 family arsenosugar biosynthesis glycosyltransferase [Salegentibacter sp. Hel_I_6]|uniref:TIGR04282 family arsenosugar biosynthesis glycosyltransferase n=1 Tax=Salegentibacter sp. Hel_I_6 TaxID=1250278 RepID=UPI000ADC810B|nr:TIGR04282 family arsenosugar biosynthesis glycosyltransferase [Salegentibacter sp. Hel_I_6]